MINEIVFELIIIRILQIKRFFTKWKENLET